MHLEDSTQHNNSDPNEKFDDIPRLEDASFSGSLLPPDIRNIIGTGKRGLVTVHGTEPYRKETLKLLALYFSGEASQEERTELAASLVFPHNKEAEELFKQKLQDNGLSEEGELKLRSYARFPGNPQAAKLHFDRELDPESITLKERIALYSAAVHPFSPSEARKLALSLEEVVTPFHGKTVSETALHRELISLVRKEVSTPGHPVSPKRKLALLFNTSEDKVAEIINDEQKGLSALESRLRKEKKFAASHIHRDALSVRLVVAVRNLISLENELHKTGAIPALSSNESLGKLFGMDSKELGSYSRFLFLPDYRYRVAEGVTPGSVKEKEELHQKAEDQVKDFLANDGDRIENDETLADHYSLSPVTVYHLLKKSLHPDTFDQRTLHLREKGELGLHLSSIKTFVKQEIHAYLQGELDTVSTDESLASLFQVTPQTIYQKLTPLDNGLTPDEFRLREFALVLQQPQDSPSVALRLHMLDTISDYIARQSPDTQLPQTPEDSLPENLQDKRWIAFKGHWYASYEEAACATLMAKYIDPFSVKEGESFQIPVNGHLIDFKVGDYFVEYHPIKLFWNSRNQGSFKSREDYLKFLEIKKTLEKRSQGQKNSFIERVRNELREEYLEDRRAVIDQSPQHRGSAMIVLESPKSVFYFLKHLGSQLPGEEKFLREFNRVTNTVKKQNKALRKDQSEEEGDDD